MTGIEIDPTAIFTPGLEMQSLTALEEALKALEHLDERQCRIVELRFFVGLENADIADILQISQSTVYREWTTARHWLAREIGRRR